MRKILGAKHITSSTQRDSTAKNIDENSLSKQKNSGIGLGCMYLSSDNPQHTQLIIEAVRNGITLLDTADIYGSDHASEKAVGEALKALQPSEREKLIIATKCGCIFPDTGGIEINGTRDYIHQSAAGSLQRLGVETIDLFYLHRSDPNTPIETSVEALAELVGQNKIAAIGLSEVTADQIRRAHKVHPIKSVQIEYSLWSQDDEENSVIATCRELGINITAYSPLGRGFFIAKNGQDFFEKLEATDFRKLLPRYQGHNLSHNLEVRKKIEAIAEENACDLTHLTLAWILHKGICPIIGTTSIGHLSENLKALQFKQQLADSVFKEIDEMLLHYPFSGARYPSPEVSGIFPESAETAEILTTKGSETLARCSI